MFRTVFCQRSSLVYLGICIVYILYLTAGAGLFSLIEGGTAEQNDIDRYLEVRRKFKEDYAISDETLDLFITRVLDAHSRGICVNGGNISENNWSLPKSFLFATALITTVGYGQVSPSTDFGKVCCIAYAIIGIPMTILLFGATIERLFYMSYKSFKHLIGTRYGLSEANIRLGLFLCVLTFVIVFVLTIPTIVFAQIEKPNWSLLDSLYFCFVSVTTIGLGDYVPGENTHGNLGLIYRLFASVYIVIGTIFLLFLVTVTSTVPYFKLGRFYHLNYSNEPEDSLHLINNEIGSVPEYIRSIDAGTQSQD